ncbi:MAG: glycoside hydrolase family 127 protein [Phycisphaerales bacterium]|nr:glycoside hydrolase family 127 protein [Phycisphaerales bacterium]
MPTNARLLAILAALVSAARAAEPLQPVPFSRVALSDPFWSPRIETIRRVTLPHCFEQCAATGRLRNFERAAGKLSTPYEGYFFNDSDVFKAIEGAANLLVDRKRPDADLDARVDQLIELIAAAQQSDGYLNTYFITTREPRWTDIKDKHELYCAGHLIEAAVAHREATGKESLWNVALRLADHIDREFGPGKRLDPCGHPEIELALLRLARAAGDEKYARLAEFFITQRGSSAGRKPFGEYAQDAVPLRDMTQVAGHAVRAMYYFSAATELTASERFRDDLPVLEKLWDDTTGSRMYVTGGIGNSAQNEGFTRPFDLPNESAYAETCASIGLVLWAHRMNLATADARYVDVLERTLYNGVLSGLSLSGDRFFYVNPLSSRGRHERQTWFACACCPPNLVRVIPTVGGFAYAHDDESIYVNLFMSSTTTIALPGEKAVRLSQTTDYPRSGVVTIRIDCDKPAEFDIAIRQPAWADVADWLVAGQRIMDYPLSRGYVHFHRTWRSGDEIRFVLPMPIKRMQADSRAADCVGRVALQRGPLVYCVEAADMSVSPRRISLPRESALSAEFRDDLLGGVTIISGRAITPNDSRAAGWNVALYEAAPPAQSVEFNAIPYYAWANRAPGEMLVWIPESPTLADAAPLAWLTASASHCYERDTLAALSDRVIPVASNDESIPRFTWWPRRGSREWVEYNFAGRRHVRGVDIFWFDDSGRGGGCALPASRRLLARVNGEWREVTANASPGAAAPSPAPQPSQPATRELPQADPGAQERRQSHHTMREPQPSGIDALTFEPVFTDALRVEVELRPNRSAGILEWKIR